MAITTDFSGTYDYEVEEAASVAQSFIEGLEEGFYSTIDQYQQELIRERAHWLKFDDFDVRAFADEFNRRTVPVCLRVFGSEVYF